MLGRFSLLGLAGACAILFACSPAASQTAAPLERRLIWADEFSGTSLDERCWQRVVEAPPWDPEQRHAYTASERNVSVRDGVLAIDAYRERLKVDGRWRDYTSGQIRTLERASWTYGYYEARIKIPPGEGVFPAFWMMPQLSEFGHWPHSGEIDIFEAIGSEPNTGYAHIHYSDRRGEHRSQGEGYDAGVPLADDFHLYGFEWRPGALRWYLDDRLVYEVTDWEGPRDPRRPHAPFDSPFFLILNLAVGGQWAGPPDEDTPWPMHMEVDYVRVYALPDLAEPAGVTRQEAGQTCPLSGPG